MSIPKSLRFAFLIEPPFNFWHKGEVVGCDIEVARHILREIGISSIEFVETEFADLLPGRVRGDWQMTTGLFRTKERAQTVSFTKPIWSLIDGLLVRKSALADITGYRSIAHNHDARIAVIRDQVQHDNALANGVPAERIAVFDTYEEAADAVLSGEVIAYASVGQAHNGYLRQNPNSGLILVDVRDAERPPASGCFAIAQGDRDFLSAVDKALETFLCSAAHRAIMYKHGFTANDVDDLVQLVN